MQGETASLYDVWPLVAYFLQYHPHKLFGLHILITYIVRWQYAKSQCNLTFEFLILQRQLPSQMVWGKPLYSKLNMSKPWYHCAIYNHSKLCRGVHGLLHT